MCGDSKFHAKKHDIWSAGVTMYMMCVGHPPFRAKSISDLFDQIKAAKIDYSHNSIFENDDLRSFLQYLLQVDPEKRLSADEVLLHPLSWSSRVQIESYEKLEVSIEEENVSITKAKFDQLLHVKHYAHKARRHTQVNLDTHL